MDEMKKLICLLLALCLTGAAALADSVRYSDCDLDKELLLSVYNASVDENGNFTALTPKARAVETMFLSKTSTYAAGGMLMFSTEIEGNFETGVSYPVLKIMYAGSAPLNAGTVMFSVGGVRYDVSVVSTVTNQGRTRIETLRAYLDENGFALLDAIREAKKASVTILGNDQYTQTAEKTAYYASQKLEISAESLDALDLPEGTPDFSSYAFREISEKAFEAKYGKMTRIEKYDLNTACSYPLDKTFGLAADTAPAATIKGVQDLLKENGFMVGASTTQMNADMISAVKTAQRYYGLNATGYADAKLIEKLENHAEMAACVREEEKTEYAYSTDDVAFSVNSWWFADRAETTVPGNGVSVSDKDNVLLIADGDIASYALKSLSLSWEVKAEAVLDDKWAFPASIYVETQEGSVLSTTLSMLREGRMLIVSEIPENAAEGGSWTLKISCGGQEFILGLSK